MKCPRLAVDVIIEYKGGIVLVERAERPFDWAIPGGFVEYGETVEEAAKREVKEETGLDLRCLKQFGVYSDPKRDPRGHTVSVVFTAKGSGTMRAASDAKNVSVYKKDEIPKLAFDHSKIIKDYFRK